MFYPPQLTQLNVNYVVDSCYLLKLFLFTQEKLSKLNEIITVVTVMSKIKECFDMELQKGKALLQLASYLFKFRFVCSNSLGFSRDKLPQFHLLQTGDVILRFRGVPIANYCAQYFTNLPPYVSPKMPDDCVQFVLFTRRMSNKCRKN